MSDLIDRQAAIDADGLDEEIRCEMCKNPMHSNRGCDGNCKYDEILYEKIIQILNKRITPLPSAQPEIIRCEDCKHRPTPTRADEGITYGFSVEFPDEKCPCQCEDGWYNWYPKNDFYCGFAERREE